MNASDDRDRTDRDPVPRRMRRVARNLTHLELQASEDGAPTLTRHDLERALGRGRSGDPELLDFYTRRGLVNALEAYGLLRLLRDRGVDPVVELRDDPDGHDLVRVTDGPDGPVLGEVAVRAETVRPRTVTGDSQGPWPARVLLLDWVLLQDPTRDVPADRRLLPGQEHAGLGLYDETMSLLVLAARRLELAAVVAFPTHYHNAVLPGPPFSFADPTRQGELRALRATLAGLDLATASWCVELGLVRHEDTGKVYTWRADEMLHAVDDRLVGWLRSPARRRAVRQAAEATALQVDLEGLEAALEARSG